MSDSGLDKNDRLFTERVKEKDVKNKEGMIYQGKKEGIDFLLCPHDEKSKCLNFTATGKYKHAMDMYNDDGEQTFCKYCDTGVKNRKLDGQKSLQSKKAKNQRLKNPTQGVLVGNQRVPFRPRQIA